MGRYVVVFAAIVAVVLAGGFIWAVANDVGKIEPRPTQSPSATSTPEAVAPDSVQVTGAITEIAAASGPGFYAVSVGDLGLLPVDFGDEPVAAFGTATLTIAVPADFAVSGDEAAVFTGLQELAASTGEPLVVTAVS